MCSEVYTRTMRNENTTVGCPKPLRLTRAVRTIYSRAVEDCSAGMVIQTSRGLVLRLTSNPETYGVTGSAETVLVTGIAVGSGLVTPYVAARRQAVRVLEA